jgi:hypothetical protein
LRPELNAKLSSRVRWLKLPTYSLLIIIIKSRSWVWWYTPVVPAEEAGNWEAGKLREEDRLSTGV